MRRLASTVAVVLAVAWCVVTALGAAAEKAATKVDFEKAEAGKAPAGWTAARGGPGEDGRWVIEEEAGRGKVVAQTLADKVTMRFPMLVLDEAKLKDGSVSVAFNAVSGDKDQAAGIVVRWVDKDNYYVVRANALEDNVRLYRIVKGERKQFGGKDIEVPPGKWHTLELAVTGFEFEVKLNGETLFKAEDAEKAFGEAGKVGLWTKADSVTRFDDVVVTPD